ncbi:MAG TPA: class I SAM-dependent methyltransferase [Bordetella sp.]|uniref:class I SAM-dependent methyltransferase n=1 Tax=Bordetella sp. TaxID=28081 RepID=UPI002ED1D78D
MSHDQEVIPESTAARVALWRALHVQIDPPPHVFEDQIGIALLAPGAEWRDRQDMDPQFTRPFRASIVARARFVEDWVVEQMDKGIGQYVILGAGLDSFVQRRPEIASRLQVFEIDRPGPQAWKRRRLVELGFGIPRNLHFVPVDFEAGVSWWDELVACGFDIGKPAMIASAGVSMYLAKDANATMLDRIASLAPGSAFAMTFLLPLERSSPADRAGLKQADKGARASGTPFISFFTPAEILALARNAGFKEIRHVPATDLAQRYFADRTDGLRPPSNGEEFLLATT